jgi:FG-GAP-like repeat
MPPAHSARMGKRLRWVLASLQTRAFAVPWSAFPDATRAEILNVLATTGRAVRDDRNGAGLEQPRVDLIAAVCALIAARRTFKMPRTWLTNFGYNAGWRVDRHPRLLVDVNGDGLADVVGFGNAGVSVALNTGSSFQEPQLWLANFGYDAGGWRVDRHPRVIGEVNVDGRRDIVGFSYKGVAVSTGR